MHITNKDSNLVPSGLTLILIHGNSPKKDIELLRQTISKPEVFTPEGTPVISIDYETYQTSSDYRDQTNLDKKAVVSFWSRALEKKFIEKLPTGGNSFKIPLQFSKTLVAGLSVCSNFRHAFYINLSHCGTEFPPVSDTNVNIRNNQKRWLMGKFLDAPANVQYIAHNVHFEYCVSMAQGFDFFWKNQTRTEGGIIDTMGMSRLTDRQRHNLKGLVTDYFQWIQPSYQHAIYMTHLYPEIAKECTSESDVVALIKSIKYKKDLDESEKNSFDKHELDLFCDKYYIDPKKLKQLLFEVSKNKMSMKYNTAPEVLAYAGQDSYWCLKVFELLSRRLNDTVTDSKHCSSLWDYYNKIEKPIHLLFAEMTYKGVCIDNEKVTEIRHLCLNMQLKLIKMIRQAILLDLKKLYPLLFGKDNSWATKEAKADVTAYLEINRLSIGNTLSSSAYSKNVIPDICKYPATLKKYISNIQCFTDNHQKHILFELLGLPILKTTPTGGICLDKYVLPRYEPFNLLTIELIGYLRKLKHTGALFYSCFNRLHNPDTQRLHPFHNQSAANTGRATCRSPNVAQLKKYGKGDLIDKAFKVRNLFKAAPGRILFAPDLSQVELRFAAHTSQDIKMLAAYNADNVDIHCVTRDEMLYGMYENNPELKDVARKYAKTINFGMLFGAGAPTLLSEFRKEGIEQFTVEDCQGFIDAWYNTYSGIRDFKELWMERCTAQKYSEDNFGRRWFLDFFDWKTQSRAGRQAYSNKIQGSCASILKIVMARLYWNKVLRECDVQYYFPVHDEMVMSVPEEHSLRVLLDITHCFNDWNFTLPIVCNVSVGRDYGELTELPSYPNNSLNWDESVKFLTDLVKVPLNPVLDVPQDNLDKWSL